MLSKSSRKYVLCLETRNINGGIGLAALRSLIELRCSWTYECRLDFATLNSLFGRNGRSLRVIDIYGHSPVRSIDDDINLKAIQSFHFTSMFLLDAMDERCWVYGVIAEGRKTLKRLTLGFELCALRAYCEHSMSHYHARDSFNVEGSGDFVGWLGLRLLERSCKEDFALHLESLHLCGIDVLAILKFEAGPTVDFTCLTALSLESCSGLEEALQDLPNGLPNLRELTVRDETSNPQLQVQLEIFMLSLNGLTKLHILLEGADNYLLKLDHILDIYGQTLQSLIWDLRKEQEHANRPTVVDRFFEAW